MKYFIVAIFCLAGFMMIGSCKKSTEDPPATPTVTSVALQYTDVSPDSTSVDMDNDGIADIILMDTTVLWYSGPPNDIYDDVQYAKSVNPAYLISWGREVPDYDYFHLAQDSVINATLVWGNRYLSYGYINHYPDAHITSYIGIKHTDANGTFYGWLKKSNTQILEVAMDTNTTYNFTVRAGHLTKE